MKFNQFEVNNTNSFLLEEVPKSIGIKYAPVKVKNCFNIKQQNNGMCRKKEQKER